MKVIIKITLLVAIASLGLWPATARAEHVYWNTRDLLADFFPKSERVSFRRVEMTESLRDRLRRRLGYQPARPQYTFYVATTGQKVDGYAIIDEQLGQHEPITFAVRLSPSAVVERQEVVVYRESRGDEVADARFRKQFIGKTSHDPLRLNDDIAAISGATISSSSMAVGVRRAVILLEEVLADDGKRASQP